jgi:hypothetical protein
MRRLFSCGVAALMLSMSIVSPVYAQRGKRDEPPPPHTYWEGRSKPPAGHEFHNPPQQPQVWDERTKTPPNWNRGQWQQRQIWLRSNGHDREDNDATVGLVVGTLLGFVLGAAVVDSQHSRAPPRLASTTLAGSLTAHADMAGSISTPAHTLEMLGRAIIVAERRSTCAS